MSLTEGLEKMSNKAYVATRVYLQMQAISLQNYMRSNFKWTPRSGRAHQSLRGTVEETSEGFEIALSHGVSYGVYLELAHEKKYAITKPTAKLKAPEVIKGFEGLMDRLK